MVNFDIFFCVQWFVATAASFSCMLVRQIEFCWYIVSYLSDICLLLTENATSCMVILATLDSFSSSSVAMQSGIHSWMFLYPHHPSNLVSRMESFVFFARRTLNGFGMSSQIPQGSGYKLLTEHIVQFQMHDCMPLDLDIKRLDDGDGMEATMTRHNACWLKRIR